MAEVKYFYFCVQSLRLSRKCSMFIWIHNYFFCFHILLLQDVHKNGLFRTRVYLFSSLVRLPLYSEQSSNSTRGQERYHESPLNLIKIGSIVRISAVYCKTYTRCIIKDWNLVATGTSHWVLLMEFDGGHYYYWYNETKTPGLSLEYTGRQFKVLTFIFGTNICQTLLESPSWLCAYLSKYRKHTISAHIEQNSPIWAW